MDCGTFLGWLDLADMESRVDSHGSREFEFNSNRINNLGNEKSTDKPGGEFPGLHTERKVLSGEPNSLVASVDGRWGFPPICHLLIKFFVAV